jgi:hypothetical protein
MAAYVIFSNAPRISGKLCARDKTKRLAGKWQIQVDQKDPI